MKVLRTVGRNRVVRYAGRVWRMDERTPVGARIRVRGIAPAPENRLVAVRKRVLEEESVGVPVGFTPREERKLRKEGLIPARA